MTALRQPGTSSRCPESISSRSGSAAISACQHQQQIARCQGGIAGEKHALAAVAVEVSVHEHFLR